MLDIVTIKETTGHDGKPIGNKPNHTGAITLDGEIIYSLPFRCKDPNLAKGVVKLKLTKALQKAFDDAS